jgi:hypothetical protein
LKASGGIVSRRFEEGQAHFLRTSRQESSGQISLRQARHLFELKDQAQGNNSPLDIGGSRSCIHLGGGNVLPSLALPAFGRKMTLHELACNSS